LKHSLAKQIVIFLEEVERVDIAFLGEGVNLIFTNWRHHTSFHVNPKNKQS
jgi:hypothetical protein